MDPARKRQIRLVIALGTAVVLAAALVYTSFSASTEAREPSDLVTANPDNSYDVTGRVVDDSLTRDGSDLTFEISDRDGSASVPVEYTGQVPDPFREGREIIITGTFDGETFVAEKDSLITKCPSKFAAEAEEDPDHVIIDDAAP
ncbi:MAG: cytochrome c maturation protein CcmE [Solirubrobacterales bacterium]